MRIKKVFVLYFIVVLIFANCRRKNSNPTAVSNDTTTELPPPPPGEKMGDTTNENNDDTSSNGADTSGGVQANFKFTFYPGKENLETGNIGMFYKESNGNNLVLYVYISGGYNVYGITFDVNYDSSKLKLKNVTEGDFLKNDGQMTNFLFRNQIVTITRVGQVSGVSGNGNVCLISLEALTTFDNLGIGFKNQNITNINNVQIFSDDKWFGGVVKYE